MSFSLRKMLLVIALLPLVAGAYDVYKEYSSCWLTGSIGWSPDGKTLAATVYRGTTEVLSNDPTPSWIPFLPTTGHFYWSIDRHKCVAVDVRRRKFKTVSRERYQSDAFPRLFTKFSKPTIDYSPDGSTKFAAIRGKRIEVWNCGAAPERIWSRRYDDDEIDSVSVSHDGELLAVGTNQYVDLFDISEPGEKIARRAPLALQIGPAVFSPTENVLATCDGRGGVSIWEPSRRQKKWRFAPKPQESLYCSELAFSSDGSYLAAVCDMSDPYGIVIWDMTRTKGRTVIEIDAMDSSIAFDPNDSNRLVAANTSLGLVEIDIERGEVKEIPDTWYIETMAFSPDGKFLATVQWNGVATVRDAKTFEELYSISLGDRPTHIRTVVLVLLALAWVVLWRKARPKTALQANVED